MSVDDLRPVRPATLEDVARVAGVSRATVSRVVNARPTVDPALRRKVQDAIEATGYVPNQAARSLVTRRTDSIALVVSERERRDVAASFVGRVFTDPHFGRVVGGLLEVLRPAGVPMALMLVDDEDSRRQLLSYLRRGHVDGAVLISSHASDPLPQLLSETGLPAVIAGNPAGSATLPYVEVDQRAGARMAVDHLVSLERRRIGTITGPQDMPAARERLTGFHRALAAHGISDAPTAEGDFTQAGGAEAMRRLLSEHPGLDGLFVASDLMAQGALLTLERRGLRVPHDIAVVGFDDSEAALACEPPLTTIRQPVEEMAAEAARLLLGQITAREAPPASSIFRPTLVERASA
ncbi:LacI family DNA-binding transcriptional regulator [Streptomyces xanthii]|uniref:LacI family DNA-binding transcriptional regulator n=1 Tax=Streptomyces xanthii TaxID=2768069 RepID=A0A7H1BHW4_9ACTN|nr:LacI family DNA-binding transcriptional regulator [Streptomyces xanthii]QNS08319.1 LacI family DNA-binding transcriptional regulator [Streptomyces xanthii]